MGAIQVAGDALEPESLARAFDSIEEVDAVISTVGGTSSNPQVDGEVSVSSLVDTAQGTCWDCLSGCTFVRSG